MSWPNTAMMKRILVIVIVLCGIVSLFAGARDSLKLDRSQDFQWSGSHMLVQHIDPWAEELQGDPHHYVQLVQHPNYLALFYILLSPLGLLPMRTAAALWMLCNITFIGVSCWCASRFFGLDRWKGIVLAMLMLMATPIRLSIGNGQAAIFVLVVLSVSLLTHRITNGRAAVAGISYVKFNFAPAVFLYLAIRSGVRGVIFSLLPAAAGLLLTWVWLGSHDGIHGLIALARAPFAVTAKTYYPRGADMNLMDVLEIPMNWLHVPIERRDLIELSVAGLLTLVFFWKARKYSDGLNVALLGILAFAFYRHHSYDATTLLFPFAFFLSQWRVRAAQVGLAALGFIFYGQRVIDVFSRDIPFIYVIDFAVMVLAVAMVWRLRENFPAEGASASLQPERSPQAA